MILTEHVGFVWGRDGGDIIIALRKGGKLRTINPGELNTGDKVVVIPDIHNKEVIQVLLLKDAEHAVRCGLEPLYAAYSREPEDLPDEEEVLNDANHDEPNDICGIV